MNRDRVYSLACTLSQIFMLHPFLIMLDYLFEMVSKSRLSIDSGAQIRSSFSDMV